MSEVNPRVWDDQVEEQGNDEKLEEQKPPIEIKCKIEGKEGTYKESITVIDRYVTRPKALEEMCMGQFAISYVYASKVPKRIIFDENGCSNEVSDQRIFNSNTKLPKYISLEASGYGKMRLRSFPAVMRIHSSKKKEGHEQHYSEMLLYTAWRDEKKQFHADDEIKCIETYYEKIREIEKNKESIYPGEATMALMEDLDLETHKPAHMFDILDSQREQENEDDQVVGAVDDPEFESFAYTGNLGQESAASFETTKYRKITLPDDTEKNFLTRRLVPEQLNILREVVGYCKDVMKAQNNLAHKVKPLRIIIHGGAGENVQKVIHRMP